MCCSSVVDVTRPCVVLKQTLSVSVCLWLKVLNDEGEDVTPRPLVLRDPFSVYDSTAGKNIRQTTKAAVREQRCLHRTHKFIVCYTEHIVACCSMHAETVMFCLRFVKCSVMTVAWWQ